MLATMRALLARFCVLAYMAFMWRAWVEAAGAHHPVCDYGDGGHGRAFAWMPHERCSGYVAELRHRVPRRVVAVHPCRSQAAVMARPGLSGPGIRQSPQRATSAIARSLRFLLSVARLPTGCLADRIIRASIGAIRARV